MILAVLTVHAADMTWTCPDLLTPADAINFRDVTTVGTREGLEALLTATSGWFDATCPSAGFTGDDACVTETGTLVAVAIGSGTTSFSVAPTSGDLVEVEGTYADLDFYYYYWEHTEITATVTWVGTLTTDLPPDRTVTLSALEEIAVYSKDEATTRSGTWDDGECAWTAEEEVYDGVPDADHTWHIETPGHVLDVWENGTGACPGTARALLDGVSSAIVPGTWVAVDVTGPDADGDGFTAATGDCDDDDASIGPCGEEIGCNGLDEDCDGVDSPDCDGDGHDPLSAGGDDCDDTSAGVHPGKAESPCNGVDDDCDGVDSPDCDGDGFDPISAGGDDCDDTNASVHPGVLDLDCDGIDQNCDGIDEECTGVAVAHGAPGEACGGCGGGSPSVLALLAALALRRRVC